MATGDIVAFLNADDVYTEGALEKVSRYFKENPECKWLTGYCKIIDEEEREVRKFITRYKNYKLRRYSPESLLIENYISQPATFWRRELIEELGYMDETLHFTMDADYWCRIGQKYDLYLIKEYLAKFRITPDTKTGSSVEKTLDESISLTRRYTENKMLLFRKKLSNLRRLIVYKHILGRFRDRGVTN
jgi:hypothetical protein